MPANHQVVAALCPTTCHICAAEGAQTLLQHSYDVPACLMTANTNCFHIPSDTVESKPFCWRFFRKLPMQQAVRHVQWLHTGLYEAEIW
jgi:hypothetical protein